MPPDFSVLQRVCFEILRFFCLSGFSEAVLRFVSVPDFVVQMLYKEKKSVWGGRYAHMRIDFPKKIFYQKMLFLPKEIFYQKLLLYYIVLLV